jgi:hypothetical protein
MTTERKSCATCGKEFAKPYSVSRRSWETTRFCSKSCANKASAPKTRLAEWVRLHGPANKGRHFPEITGTNNPAYSRVELECFVCGKPFTVKNYRKSTAKFCSPECSSRHRDEGKSTECKRVRKAIEYRLWREAVFARDNWTCQKTGRAGCALRAHHIVSFADQPATRTAIDNGITLSDVSHKAFHAQYGQRHTTAEQLEAFLASVQET